jgi:hypothetical protein
MPFYYSLKREPPAVQKRAAEALQQLRASLDAAVPPRTISDTLLLATWNIREFDSEKYGARCTEAFFYIAEILERFDLIAIQEVNRNLAALDRLQEVLGGWWKYIVTDVTEGVSGANERMAFLYDSRKVVFGGLAGEIVLPAKGANPALQLARTPFVCGFKAGWSKFNLCTVHIYYGDDTKDNPRRVEEIRELATLLAKRSKQKQPRRPEGQVTPVPASQPENLVLLGDFNIFHPSDATMKAMTDAGFVIPPELQQLPASNLGQTKYYDQIAFLAQRDRFDTTGRAGVFDYSKIVFKKDDDGSYVDLLPPQYAAAKNKKTYYNMWRTFQMSDHLLMWVELRIDYGKEYLQTMQG